jgi:hypothetical protein
MVPKELLFPVIWVVYLIVVLAEKQLTSPESRVEFEVIHKPCMEVGWCSDGSPAGITKLLRVFEDLCHLLTPGQRTELYKFGLGGDAIN